MTGDHAPPASQKPPTVPPLPIILIAFALAGCTAAQVRTATPVALELEQMACVFAQGELGKTEPKAIALACSIPPSAIESVVNALLAQKKGHALAAAAKAEGSK